VLAAAAALAFLATVMLAVRTGDSAPIPRAEVVGARATRDAPTSAPKGDVDTGKSAKSQPSVVVVTTSTTLTLETLPAAPLTSAGSAPTTILSTPNPTSTTVARATTTTTTPPPRDVTEESDNTAEYKWTKDGSGGSSTTPDTQPPSDPLTFLVSAQWDHDNVARLNAKLDNNTDRPITFPGPDGFVLRFLIDHDGQPWRTVEVKRDDIQTLPAHAEIVVVGQVFMDQGGYGTYDVGGEINVRYS
jgi:hypothetical protein